MRYFRVDATSKGGMRVPDDLPDLHEPLATDFEWKAPSARPAVGFSAR